MRDMLMILHVRSAYPVDAGVFFSLNSLLLRYIYRFMIFYIFDHYVFNLSCLILA